jgi:hypothetical protein
MGDRPKPGRSLDIRAGFVIQKTGIIVEKRHIVEKRRKVRMNERLSYSKFIWIDWEKPTPPSRKNAEPPLKNIAEPPGKENRFFAEKTPGKKCLFDLTPYRVRLNGDSFQCLPDDL